MSERTIGDIAKEHLRLGKDNQEVLDEIKKVHPDARSSVATVSWYRSRLRAAGENIPTVHQIKKARANQ